MFTQHSRPTLAWRGLLALLLAGWLGAAPAAARQGAAATAATAAAAATLSEAEREAAARVKVETIREVTAALSAPGMQGRGTGQPGGERAAQYLAGRFASLGLKPLGDKNTYFQVVKFREYQVAPESFFRVEDEALRMGEDFYATPPHTGDEDVSGRLVFVGYGVRSSVLGRDDLKGIDVRGKVVVMLQGPPPKVTKEFWQKVGGHWSTISSLVAAGAAGVVIAGTGTPDRPYATSADYVMRRQIEPPDTPQYPAEWPPLVAVSDAGAEKLFAGAGATYAQAREQAARGEPAARELKREARIRVRIRNARVSASNVVGLLEGSDPALKAEAVVYTAHYDAFGVGADGRVFPGAADNALGVAEMISIAEALAGGRPRRSVVFLAVTGEEYGLHGAEYWVRNPTWKLRQVAANFNFDGIGTEVYGPLRQLVGFGAEHSDLGAALEAVAAATGNRVVPDPMPEERTFYRSDHYAFVKRGVPALMLMGAPDVGREAIIARVREYEKQDYHQPTDTVKPEWDWEGARGIAQVGAVLGLRVANADAMPAWLSSSPFNRERGTDKPPPPER